MEIITDPDGKGWYRDSDEQENGDICNFDVQTQCNIIVLIYVLYNKSKKYHSNIQVGSKRSLVQVQLQPGVGCVLERKNANSAGSK
jgi:hypothetical protein